MGWQCGKKKVLERMTSLFNSEDFADVVFGVGRGYSRRRFPAHRVVLGMTSEVFAAMFYGPVAENDTVIELLDVDPNAFHALLRYSYTDEVKLDSIDHAIKTAYVATKYLIHELREECLRYLRRQVTPYTACQVYEAAQYLDDKQLLLKSTQFITRETEIVLSSPAFLSARSDTVETIAKQNRLNVQSETVLFDAMRLWGEMECERQGLEAIPCNVRSLLTPMLRHVRFLTMTLQELLTCMTRSCLFGDHEVLAVMSHSANLGDARPLPDLFSQNRRHRARFVESLLCRIHCAQNTQNTRQPLSFGCHFTASRDLYVTGIGFHLEQHPHPFWPTGRRDVPSSLEIPGTLLFRDVTGKWERSFSVKIELPRRGAGENRVLLKIPQFLTEGHVCEVTLKTSQPASQTKVCVGPYKPGAVAAAGVEFHFQPQASSDLTSHVHEILFWYFD